MIKEETYNNGKSVGLWKGWHENGPPLMEYERNYKEGKQDGLAKSFYENGQLRIDEAFKGGKREGNRKLYNEEGKPKKKPIKKVSEF